MANQDLIECISHELSEGKTEDAVRENMKSNGWSQEDINGALAIVKINEASLGMGGHLPKQRPSPQKSSNFFSLVLLFIIFGTLSAIGYSYLVRVEKIAPLSFATIDSLLVFVTELFK